MRGHAAPEETDRANAALSHMDSGLLETDSKLTGEEPLGLESKDSGPGHQKGRAREAIESPAESAVDVAESSKRSATRRVGCTQSPGGNVPTT